MVNGMAHGPDGGTAVCQLHMRRFADGDILHVEPWRAEAFPVIKDLVVDRSAFDRIIEAGGYVSVNCGSAPDANSVLVKREDAESSFEAAACIGCGACVAACPNGSAMLFTAAKLVYLGRLPQGQPERLRRTRRMVDAMDEAGFGNCTNHYECEAVCPARISAETIAIMNREYLKATLRARE
jgi:succinate dehydrogenase / fumarate reductase, iron-sulfur subunit